MNRFHRWLCRSSLWKRNLETRLLPWALGGISLGGDVLEIGAGPGLTTELLRPRAERLTSVEIDAALAAALGERTRGSNVRVLRGDATALPFADGSFSSAVAFTMLHHVASSALQDRLLAEVFRVLRPGGVFIGTDSVVSLSLRLIHIGDTLVPVDPAGFEPRLRAAGFHEVAIERRLREFRFRARRG